MSKLVRLQGINTNSLDFKQRVQAANDTRHALSVLELIIERAGNQDLQDKGSEAIATLRAALAR